MNQHPNPMTTMARLAAAALGVFALAGTAFAQDATRGETLYKSAFVPGMNDCGACHDITSAGDTVRAGSDAAATKAAATAKVSMRKMVGVVTDAQYNDLAAYIAKTTGATPKYLAVAAPTPTATVSAATLTFASQNVGTASAAQTITLTSTAGGGTLTLSALGVSAGSDFTLTGGTCAVATPVAAGASCTVNVVFKPTAMGTRNGTLTVAHNGTGGKSEVALTGTAVNASASVSVMPATLTLSSMVNTTSSPMRVTFSNTGTGPVSVKALTLGGAQAADYAIVPSSTCAAGTSVAGSSSCTVDVSFKPAATGARAGTLTIAHDGPGTPSVVTLAGSGTAAAEPGIALDALSLDFGAKVNGVTSAAKTMTLTNSGNAPLLLNAVTLGGTDAASFVAGGTCAAGTTVAARGTCTVTVAMKPASLGPKTATLSITSNASTGAATVALKGTSVATAEPEVGLSQPSLGFGRVTVGTKAMGRVVQLTNTGTGDMTIAKIASQSTEYAATHDCPSTLEPEASCTVTVVYTPSTPNSSSSVVIETNAKSSPNSITVTGQGVAEMLPTLAWEPASTSLKFASTLVGASSATQMLTLVNKGPGAVTIDSIGTAGADATSFAIAAMSTCKAGLSLPMAGTCTVALGFTPDSTGAKTANLQIGSTGTPPSDVLLLGSGASPGSSTGSLTVSMNTLDFSSIKVAPGTTSAPMSVTLSNGSAANVAIASIKVTGPFALQSGTGACPAAASLAAGASCKVNVAYAPVAGAATTGTLSITTGGGQTLTVALKGSATSTGTSKLTPDRASLDYGTSTKVGETSASMTVTLANGGTSLVALKSIGTSGHFKITAGTCTTGASLAVNATCTASIAFVPQFNGTNKGSFSVTTTGGDEVVVPLTGVAAPNGGPVLAWAAGTSTDQRFDDTRVGAVSPTRTLELSNAGPGAATFAVIGAEGAGQDAFVTAEGTTCSGAAPLAQGASCKVVLAFTPKSAGAAAATLQVSSNGMPPATVSLSGTGLPGGAGTGTGALHADYQQLGFMGLRATPSAPQTVTFKNNGAGALTLSNVVVTGPFQVVSSPSDACAAPQALAPAATCKVSVVFVATGTSGVSEGTLTVSAGDESRSVTLKGSAMVGNAGSNDLEDEGGGAIHLLTLIALALLVPAAAVARRTRHFL